MMVSAGSITVAVRVRPPTTWEAARLPEVCYDTSMRGDGALAAPAKPVANQTSLREIVQLVDDRILTFDPPDQDRSRAFVERGIAPPGTKRYKDRRFMFDRVFRHDARQTDVFDGTSKPLLDGLLDGYNATIFAYGATGCGKTHTISGTDEDPGIIYLTMAELFQRLAEGRDEHNYDVVVTFLEIYNEEIRDLLSDSGSPTPRGGLQIREDKQVRVVGLTELRPMSADEVKNIVALGNSRRTQSPTHANETSSRSHAVLQVHVTRSPRTADTTEERTMATLSIIDLAGSERAAATTNMGQRMVEGANINKSLLALGNCINALCESGGGIRHVPYRNSKLTRLLKFSLGGNCKTVMIVCIAPTSVHYDDTHNTLVYAERATKIRTKVVTRNVVNVDRHVGQYVEAINRLRCEVAELKEKLSGKLGSDAEAAKRKAREAKEEYTRQEQILHHKADDVRLAILDGGYCEAAMSVSRTKLGVLKLRAAQLDRLALESDLSSVQVTERELLRALRKEDDAALEADSLLNTRLRRASNSASMFEGVLRAASEIRCDRLDAVHVEKLQLDVRYQKSEMERHKAEAQNRELKRSVEAQAELVVHLVGMLARCTSTLQDEGRSLLAAVDGQPGKLEEIARTVASSFQNISNGNKSTFASLLGRSLADFPAEATSLKNLTEHASVKRPALQPQLSSIPPVNNHRVSLSASASPRRRTSHGRSFKKTARPSNARTPLDHGKDRKKSVRFDDEQVIQTDDYDAPFSASTRNTIGSESEWEDEKTEESVGSAFLSVPAPPRRLRKSILDPGSNFLRGKGPSLTMLAEGDEIDASDIHLRRASPFSDRANRLPTPPSLEAPGSRDSSPSQRTNMLRVPGPAGKNGRRKSQVGPVRSEKRIRKRTSLISSPAREVAKMAITTKRVPASPSKRPSTLSQSQSKVGIRASLRTASSSSMTSTPDGICTSSADTSKSRAWR